MNRGTLKAAHLIVAEMCFLHVYASEAEVPVGAFLKQTCMPCRCVATLQILGNMEVLGRTN